ncbi:uncharacterized protein TNCV_3313551 [Trichonephila clavipes]|nr:uncharacterized protein TNCV_3313551 [Trichonephila clavipes]
MGSMPDAPRYHASTQGLHAEIVKVEIGGDRLFGEFRRANAYSHLVWGYTRDDPVLHERDQALEFFKETVEFEKGRYIVQLPFRKSYNELSDNYPLAKQRFQNLWKRFGHDSELYQQYREIIHDYTEQGIIEELKTEITDNKLKRPVYYLPHQAVYRFNRVNFGVSSSPLLLAATIRHHIEKYKHEVPDTVQLLDKNFYVDDLISGGNEFEEALQTSRRAKNIMEAAGMDLRKMDY